MSALTPNRSFLNPSNSQALEKSLSLNRTRREVRNSVIWGAVNFLILAVIVYDLGTSCWIRDTLYDYIRYIVLLAVSLNLLFYAAKVTISRLNNMEQVPVTLEQKKLLGISDSDPNFQIVESLQSPETLSTPPRLNLSTSSNYSHGTPMNTTALSWQSGLSPIDTSLNYSVASPSWQYYKNMSPSLQNSPTFQHGNTTGYASVEKDLSSYYKSFDGSSNVMNLNNSAQPQKNLLSSFWSHPVTKTAEDMSSFLKRCTYQLSSQLPASLNSSSPKNKTDKSSPNTTTSALAPWVKVNVDIVALTQWNENLRLWISNTILERLVKEFDKVNEEFDKHGLSDIRIGSVGLDRLRKTAQVTHVTQFIPSLPTLIPFLEVTPNQEYLEKRIRELTKGGCMSEYKWNGGSSYNGKEWDESLPTDAAIIMHLLASYLDTQLMPLPSMPDTKPFSGLHYLKAKDKMPNLSPNSLFIQQVSERAPHYRVIIGENIYEMVKGYSNLFHTILFFLFHVNQQEHGMLGRVYLGRSGVNMLWIIGQ